MKNPTRISVLVIAAATLALPKLAGAQDAKHLFFEADTVRHAIEGQAGPFCVQGNQYKRKEGVAWRIRVLDESGKSLDDKGLKGVVVQLGDGQKIEAKWGGHPPRGAPPTDYFWSLHWVIPADYPTGSLGYKIIATDLDGHAHTWEPFKRAPTQLTVVAGEPALKQN